MENINPSLFHYKYIHYVNKEDVWKFVKFLEWNVFESNTALNIHIEFDIKNEWAEYPDMLKTVYLSDRLGNYAPYTVTSMEYWDCAREGYPYITVGLNLTKGE